MNTSQCYDPCEVIFSDCTTVKYGMIVLNRPINFSSQPNILLRLWSHAKVRITVDGGTDMWLNWLTANKFDSNEILNPDLITGDFDSVLEETLSFFKKKNVAVIETPDQNHTDFTKALFELNKYCRAKALELDHIYVVADTSGRLDQQLGNIHTHSLARDIFPTSELFQLASNSISWMLNAGKHSITIPTKLRHCQEWCALIPIYGDCHISTTGLKWNLSNDVLEFGKFISTSNTYDDSPVVTVETDYSLLWSMGIEPLL